MAGDEPEKGDKVSWNWGNGAPGGTVAEKKTEGEVAIKTKRGNTVKKNAEPDNPAVRIERSGNDVVKKASELNIEEKASGSNDKKREHEDDEAEAPLVENEQGKEVKPGGKEANKKQKTAPKKKNEGKKVEKKTMEEAEKKEEKKEEKEEEKKEEKEEEEKEEKTDDKKETNGETTGPRKKGRPKKGTTESGAPKKKEPKPRSADGIGSRTRSRAK